MGSNKNDDVAANKQNEHKLREILTGAQLCAVPYETATDFRKWFLQYFSQPNEVSLEQFAIFYLNAVRQLAYRHLRASETSTTAVAVAAAPIPVIEQQPRNKAAILPATPTLAHDIHTKCSTPLRRGGGGGTGQRRSIERSFGATTSNSSSFEKSRNFTGDGSFCLGDFIISSPNVSGGRHGSSHKKKSQATAVAQATTTPKSSGGGSKPKKRVVPISIGGKTTSAQSSVGDCSSPFGVHSRSFERDCNNLFMNTPTVEASELAEARKSLKRDLSEASTAFKAAAITPTKTPTKMPAATGTQALQQIKLDQVHVPAADESNCLSQLAYETRTVLRLLANIYGLLMDMNFVINILNEFSFLLNLLNAGLQTTPANSQTKELTMGGLGTLQPSINCVYFAVCVLECQQHALVQLDSKSLGVVLQCERLERLAPLLRAQLCAAYEQKQALPYQLEQQQLFATITDSSFKNVCFQEDSDSRKFFSSSAEFGAFKTQRDLFYNVLKLWEKHHLHPAWSFNSELAPKVRDIFRQSEHPVNMAHFAKLFVSQLLVSASDKTSPEDLGFGNEDVDLQKFNKLAQRLVAPSNYSVDYQFPREQAFFRDFIVESRSLSFMEQLKMVIYSELITLNDSTLEHLNLSLMTANEERDHDLHDRSEYVVEPTVLSAMLILAKFFGFVSALPYQGGGATAEPQNSALIQRQQLKLRQLFCAPFDVCQLLDVAMASGRLLITLPWLVQYMAMLDAVTLQLSCYASVLQKMFALYAAMGGAQQTLERAITPMSGFIVRCCLGWLFEQKPGIAAEYYNFRAANYQQSKAVARNPDIVTADQQACAVLETVLAVACPYLAEFRVSIMPAKHALTKNVSRSGRYRHITPSIAEAPTLKTASDAAGTQEQLEQQTNSNNQALSANLSTDDAKQRQRKLMEGFLHAQNSSMRRLIVFLTERTYKCVVKDAQFQILLPSKSAADSRVNELSSNVYEHVFAEVQAIYRAARANAIQRWDSEVPGMLRKRVTQGLEALLPVETAPIVKKAYAWRIQSDANLKISQWRHMNLFKHDFYCNDLEELAEKLCKANTNRPKQPNGGAQQSTELKLIKAKPSISDLLEELQHWLYITSGMSQLHITPAQCPTNNSAPMPTSIDEALIGFVARLTDSFENVLPTIYYRLIGAGLIQVLHHLIATQPAALSATLIKTFCDFCLDERMQQADERTTGSVTNTTTTTTTTQSEQTNISSDPPSISDPPSSASTCSSSTTNSSAVTTIYHALVSAPFIQTLQARRVCFDKLKELFLALIQNKIISIDFVNELFIVVFKQDLCQATLNETSRLLSELAAEVGDLSVDADAPNCSNDFDDDMQKSKLFMQVLAEFSRDIEDF